MPGKDLYATLEIRIKKIKPIFKKYSSADKFKLKRHCLTWTIFLCQSCHGGAVVVKACTDEMSNL